MKKFFNSFTAKLALIGALAISVLAFQAPAQAGISLSTVTRTAEMQAIITAAGATGAKLKLYNGCTVPTGVAAATGCTLLATLNWTSVPVGSATGGTIAWDNASVSQTSSSHVAGTPLFAHITTSADVVVARVDICGAAPCWTFTGAVANAQNVTLTGLVFTAGNP